MASVPSTVVGLDPNDQQLAVSIGAAEEVVRTRLRGRPPAKGTSRTQQKQPNRVVVYKEGEVPFRFSNDQGDVPLDALKKAYHLTPKSSARLAARKASEVEQLKLEVAASLADIQMSPHEDVLEAEDDVQMGDFEDEMEIVAGGAGVGSVSTRRSASSRKAMNAAGSIPILANFDSEAAGVNTSGLGSALLQNYISEDGFYKEWPIHSAKPIDFQDACDIILGAANVTDNKICDDVPRDFRGQGTFIIDLDAFENKYAVHCDGLGSWGKPTGRTRFYKYEERDGGAAFVRLDNNAKEPLEQGAYDVRVLCKRYEHPNARGLFYKKIYTGIQERRDAAGNETSSVWLKLAVVSYQWRGMPIEFEVTSTNDDDINATATQTRMHAQGGSTVRKCWEYASRTAALTDKVAKEFDGCPLYSNGAIAFEEVAQVILGSLEVEAAKVCDHAPQGFRGQGTFIIDMRRFDKKGDLRRDGNGIWGKPAGHSRYYQIDQETGIAVRVDKSSKLVPGAVYDVQILAKRYEHEASDGRFVRKIYTGRGPNATGYSEVICDLAVMTYFWKGEPFDFDPRMKQTRRSGPRGPRKRIAEMSSLLSSPAIQFEENGEQYSQYYGGEEDDDESNGDDSVGYGSAAKIKRQQTPVDKNASFGSHSQQPRYVRFTAKPNTLPNIATSSATRSIGSTPSELVAFKRQILEREYENQLRFTSILDRAETLLGRFEQTDFVPGGWAHAGGDSASGSHPQQRTTMVVQEDVIVGQDGQQYVAVNADDYRVQNVNIM